MTDAPRNTTGHVSVADEPAVRQIVADSLLKLWDVVNQLTRLRPTWHERYRVTIFGSARGNVRARTRSACRLGVMRRHRVPILRR